MGVIYQAHDPVIDRKVAIKLIRADLLSGEDQADYLARFQHEARAAGRCAHPNIVAIYDFAVHEGNPFLAMEFVEASNLSQVLATSGRFSPAAAIALITQVLDALACAHGLGVVHRDVKPANILLLADGRVKMTDFGISRLDTSALTQSGSVIGTPSYMSPEQCQGLTVDARSDLFSTGVVLYELLSGERPFAGRTLTEVALQLLREEPPHLASKCPELPQKLVAAVHRALAKRPDDRFASAAGMSAALRDALQTEDDRTVVVSRTTPAEFTSETLNTIERKLAQRIGPIARHLVQSAARQATSLNELHTILQRRIESASGVTTPTQSHGTIDPALVQRAERELTRYVGPIARILVKRTLAAAKSPDEFRQTLASHIERDADRQAFTKLVSG
jgi:eukaryotic-like serine/threonine-protein kinase